MRLYGFAGILKKWREVSDIKSKFSELNYKKKCGGWTEELLNWEGCEWMWIVGIKYIISFYFVIVCPNS